MVPVRPEEERVKGLARLFVATAAGAGMGAAAALAKRHLLSGHADGRTWTPPGQPAAAWKPFDQEAPAAAAPPPPPVSPSAPRPAAPPAPVPAPLATDIADLESARVRLRRRAAELRAEMEGRAGVP